MAFNNKELEDCINSSAPIETPSSQPLQLSVDADGNIEDGGRNTTLYKIACHLYFKGLDDEYVRLCISSINNARCKPPLTEAEVNKSIDSARSSWEKSTEIEWPPIQQAITNEEDLPPEQPDLIQGLHRKGGIFLLSGPSKFGKTNLLTALAIALQNGLEWLGFKCNKSKVLYINLEIDEASYLHRANTLYKIYEKYKEFEKFDIWTLTGLDVTLDKLKEKLLAIRDYDLIIIDPLYMLNEGDENSASEQVKTMRKFGRIAKATNSSVLICHHHSKGADARSKSINRASGSGVFGRYPDTHLDVIPQEITPPLKHRGHSAFVVSCDLRHHPPIDAYGVWWKYPKYEIDEDDLIIQEYNKHSGKKRSANNTFNNVLEAVNKLIKESDHVNAKDVEKMVDVKEKTVSNNMKKLEPFGYVWVSYGPDGCGCVQRLNEENNTNDSNL